MSKISADKMFIWLLIISVIALPFNGTLVIDSLTFFSKHGQTYPVLFLLIGWFIYLLFKKKIVFPRKEIIVIYMSFIFAIIMSGIMNITEMVDLKFQGKDGWLVFIVSTMKFLLFFLVPIAIYNLFRNYDHSLVRLFEKGVYYSAIIVFIYSIIEIMCLLDISVGVDLKNMIDKYFLYLLSDYEKAMNDVSNQGRMHSVASEASYFSMYIFVLLPYLFKLYIENSGKKKIICMFATIYCFVLLIFTYSRTAYFGSVIICFFIFWLQKSNLNTKKIFILLITSCVFFAAVIQNEELYGKLANVIFSFVDETDYDSTNVARFGSAVAAFSIFIDYPLFGVGWGEYGFYAAGYYPQWSWASPEIIMWSSNTEVDASWPQAANLYVKLMAETGIFGMITFMMIFLQSSFMIYKLYLKSIGDKKKSWAAFLVAFLSLILGGFNVDTIYYIYWIMIGIVWHDYRLVEKG